MYMNGFYPNYNNYDPFPWIMMMNQNWRKPEEEKLKEEDIIKLFRKYQELKKEFEPPKKEGGGEKKKEDAWTTNDYFTFIVCFLSTSVLVGGWFILRELVEFARVIHAH